MFEFKRVFGWLKTSFFQILLKKGDLKLVENCLVLKYLSSLPLKEALKSFPGDNWAVWTDFIVAEHFFRYWWKIVLKREDRNKVKGTRRRLHFCYYFSKSFRIHHVKKFMSVQSLKVKVQCACSLHRYQIWCWLFSAWGNWQTPHI